MRFFRILGLTFGFLLIASCSTPRKISYKSSDHHKRVRVAKTNTKAKSRVRAKSESKTKTVHKEADSVLKAAHGFLGTPYKYGGVTRSGLDCSGLVINSYNAAGIQMPRMSKEQANTGTEIKLKDVREGDLVFFITSGSNINHVGIVDRVDKGEVFFIHSSTSKGVIVSSLEETYWNRRFVKATRVL
ncbi:MAG: C40 family peptidase [Moheibacter sp.]